MGIGLSRSRDRVLSGVWTCVEFLMVRVCEFVGFNEVNWLKMFRCTWREIHENSA